MLAAGVTSDVSDNELSGLQKHLTESSDEFGPILFQKSQSKNKMAQLILLYQTGWITSPLT